MRTVAEWVREIDRFRTFYNDDRRKFRRFAQWYANNQNSGVSLQLGGTDVPVEANMIHSAARATRAEMAFRPPRFQITPPQSTFGATVFNDDLAKVEARLLNDGIEERGLFRKARRVLLDAWLGFAGVLKQGYTTEIVQDIAAHERIRQQAKGVGLSILSGKKPRAGKNEAHSIYIDELEAILAGVDRGDFNTEDGPVPREYKKYLENHIKARRKILAESGERPTETTRNERIFSARINPLQYYFDPDASDVDERRWVGHSFYLSRNEVANNPVYNAEARKKLPTPSSEDKDKIQKEAGNELIQV